MKINRLQAVSLCYIRFQVLPGTNIKIVVFWDVAKCSLVDTDVDPKNGGSKLV
jgi:hypothetical protein